MTKSNADEIRRVRHEMFAEAGQDVRKLIAMLSPLRERVAKRLVDHGGNKAKQSVAAVDAATSSQTRNVIRQIARPRC